MEPIDKMIEGIPDEDDNLFFMKKYTNSKGHTFYSSAERLKESEVEDMADRMHRMDTFSAAYTKLRREVRLYQERKRIKHKSIHSH